MVLHWALCCCCLSSAAGAAATHDEASFWVSCTSFFCPVWTCLKDISSSWYKVGIKLAFRIWKMTASLIQWIFTSNMCFVHLASSGVQRIIWTGRSWNVGLGVMFKINSCLLALWTWTEWLTSLNLHFLLCKVKRPTLWDRCENSLR